MELGGANNNDEDRRAHPSSFARIIPDEVAEGMLPKTVQKLELAAIGALKPQGANPRTHSRQQIEKIAASIQRFGVCNPVLIDDDNQIIAGHGRFEAAKLLGLTTVPVLRLSHLSDAEKRAYLIADNRLAELAGWDRDVLATELEALLDLDFEVELTGFDIGRVEIMLEGRNKASAGKSDSDSLSESNSGAAVCRPGDEWLLGAHRLLCGESRNQSAYAAADAAIRRWQTFTRQSAVLAGTNKSFNQIKTERAKRKVSTVGSTRDAAPHREAA